MTAQCGYGMQKAASRSVRRSRVIRERSGLWPSAQMVISIVNVFAIIDAVIVRAVVLLNIAAVGAIFIIVADVVDVISSSRTTEYPDHAHLHHRLAQTILGIEDAITS